MNSPNTQAHNKTNATIISIGIVWRERGCDFENFGARIIEFGVVVEKIWLKDVMGVKWNFWKVLGLICKIPGAEMAIWVCRNKTKLVVGSGSGEVG
jgi:hypothetical protein